jgi:hypothetical protein
MRLRTDKNILISKKSVNVLESGKMPEAVFPTTMAFTNAFLQFLKAHSKSFLVGSILYVVWIKLE